MPERLDAAIFDADGTVLDTREFIFQAYEHTLTVNGHEVPNRMTIAAEIGRSLADCYQLFAPEGENDILCQVHRDFQSESLHLIESFEGISETLDLLKQSGLRLGIYTGRKSNVLTSLATIGIEGYFDVIVKGDDVSKPKPHPEGILRALRQLSVYPTRAAMLGDAVVDVEAGKAAGVAITVGITHGFGTKELLQQANPDYLVDHLSEIQAILLQ